MFDMMEHLLNYREKFNGMKMKKVWKILLAAILGMFVSTACVEADCDQLDEHEDEPEGWFE